MPEPRERKPPSMSNPDNEGLGQLGEYRLLEQLGEGGMGVVYKALQTELDRVVALKVLPEGRAGDEQAIARFQQEMKAVGQLDHPNIIRAHDAREIEGTRVLVTEYIDGLDLSELVECLGPLPVADACELLRQAAVGLQYAHERALVHRDIKPSNLMLSRDARVKILDLGLARIQAVRPAGEEMTVPGQVIGTPDYMAPEQVSDSHIVDIRADVYSLGCTLYKLLSGQAPFSGPAYSSAFDKMSAQVREPVPPIRTFRDDVPDELVAVLDRMLAKAPRERFATPGQLADAVGRFATGSDLPRLLAKAEGKRKPPRQQGKPLPKVGHVATRPVTGTLGNGSTDVQPRLHRAGAWWRRPWVIAVCLALTVVGVGLAVATGMWQAENGGTQRETPPPPPLPSPSPPSPSPPLPARPTPARFRQRLVFSWTPPRQAGKPNLWLFRPGGQQQRPVTRDPDSVDLQPMFSPDGRRIVFTRAAFPSLSSTVCVCNTDGSNLKKLVTPEDESECFLSPVWVSDSRIYYTRDPDHESPRHMEVWQVDPDGKDRQLVFRFKERLKKDGGLVTDVSPDGRQLAVIAQQEGDWSTADVYITDLKGNLLHTVWEDSPDDHADAGALWSPNGKTIVWHHNITPGAFDRAASFGVGRASLGEDGKWTARVPRQTETFVTPVAWADDSRVLLCARIHESRRGASPATLLLKDAQLQPVKVLFGLPRWRRSPEPWCYGRPGDWGAVPADALLSPPDVPGFRRPGGAAPPKGRRRPLTP